MAQVAEEEEAAAAAVFAVERLVCWQRTGTEERREETRVVLGQANWGIAKPEYCCQPLKGLPACVGREPVMHAEQKKNPSVPLFGTCASRVCQPPATEQYGVGLHKNIRT